MSNDLIKQHIETLLRHMGVSFTAVEVSEADGRTRFSIQSPDSHLLIGVRGATLFALNHVLKRMAWKGGENAEELDFFVDVNDYQEAARENLLALAKVMGERARSFKSSIELDPMSSYERMIVHAHFQGAGDLTTESVGAGEQRRVVIKYVEQRVE